MIELIDSHCHLDVEQFDDDREAMIQRAAEAGVVAMVVPGINEADIPRVLALAEKHPQIYVGVGIHPHETETWRDGVIDELRSWVKHPKVVAIGEIGLDYYYQDYPREVQLHMIRQQVRFAREAGKPIIVHDRDAHGDVLEVLKSELDPAIGGVMHCFSGSGEFARECMQLGMMISFAGPVTFKNATKLQEAARSVPLDHLLIETDSPYLTPTPYRGKRNEPAYVRHVAEKLAELHGVSLEELARHTTANTRKLFKLPA